MKKFILNLKYSIYYIYKGYPKIHAKFEFCDIRAIKCCQWKKERKDKVTGSELLKMER